MKTNLQERAEKAFERFSSARRPIVIEFAGVPKAGVTGHFKTSQPGSNQNRPL
jgi:hypothetical protein